MLLRSYTAAALSAVAAAASPPRSQSNSANASASTHRRTLLRCCSRWNTIMHFFQPDLALPSLVPVAASMAEIEWSLPPSLLEYAVVVVIVTAWPSVVIRTAQRVALLQERMADGCSRWCRRRRRCCTLQLEKLRRADSSDTGVSTIRVTNRVRLNKQNVVAGQQLQLSICGSRVVYWIVLTDRTPPTTQQNRHWHDARQYAVHGQCIGGSTVMATQSWKDTYARNYRRTTK